MVAETRTAKMQMVWNKTKKRTRPMVLKPFQFEAAMDEARTDSGGGGPSGVSAKFGELSVLDSLQKEERANDKLSEKLLYEGNRLAEEGKFGEALGKWETAIFLTPQKALLHEQKAQVLLEIGKTWGAVQAATSATQLQPTWIDAWVTLARAQLNYGEPYLAVESARAALKLDPAHKEANTEFERAQFLAIRQRQATRDSAAFIVDAEAVLPDGQNRLPSCRRAKVYDSDDIGFGEEHHQAAHPQAAHKEVEVEKEDSDEEKLYDKYDDDDYDWVDEVRKPPLLTDENLLSDFSDI